MSHCGLATIHIACEVDAHGLAGVFVGGLLGWRERAAGEGDEGEGAAGVGGKDADGAVDIAVDRRRLGEELQHGGGVGDVVEVAVAFGADGLDVEGVLVDVGDDLVGVAQADEGERGVVVLAVDIVVGSK